MNEITAFYRKYRPQTVEDLDSQGVRDQLTTILKSGKVPHAFLFSGPRGTGKTSSGRILAKAINCTDKRGFEPCNKCEACLSITAGSNVDVIEVDGASNRGIDEIRDLREKIKLMPTSLSKKVYIIDEVHMLTNEAFNALLKTLEEPPAHAFFVLCTTEVHKIPETIISRCQKINFKRASTSEILRALSRVVASEKIEIEKTALEEIAKQADGSFRDGVKILEQASLSNKKIYKKDLTEDINLESFFEILYKKDVKDGIDFVNKVYEAGVDLKILNIKILDYLRNLLLTTKGVEIEENVKSFDFSAEDLVTLIDLFSKAIVDFKNAVILQLPLELAIVEWCKNKSGSEKMSLRRSEATEAIPSGIATLPPVARNDTKLSLEDFTGKWPEILKSVKPFNHSVEAFLKAASPSLWDGKYLTLKVFYKFHKERLEDEKCRVLIEKVISDLMSTTVKLKFVLGEDKPAAKNSDSVIKAAEEIFGGKAE